MAIAIKENNNVKSGNLKLVSISSLYPPKTPNKKTAII